MSAENKTRINEWFVPKFGPLRFRVFVGLLFLPYTGMCVSFAIVGSMLASEIAWDRLGAIALIYVLALGISAHVADSLGSKKTKPWGIYFSKTQLLIIMAASLTAAYAIGAYYIAFFVPLLAIIAALEGFFLFTYNY
jgi:small-conductance mechanosensitive channel